MLAALTEAAAGEGPVAERAQSAGERWAAGLDLGSGGVIDALSDVFAQLGFAPERAEGGLALRACPFLDDARRHPEVVCGVHRGLAIGIARRAGGEVELRPFQGDVCVLAILARSVLECHRADLGYCNGYLYGLLDTTSCECQSIGIGCQY